MYKLNIGILLALAIFVILGEILNIKVLNKQTLNRMPKIAVLYFILTITDSI